jgi:hypothetical protein
LLGFSARQPVQHTQPSSFWQGTSVEQQLCLAQATQASSCASGVQPPAEVPLDDALDALEVEDDDDELLGPPLPLDDAPAVGLPDELPVALADALEPPLPPPEPVPKSTPVFPHPAPSATPTVSTTTPHPPTRARSMTKTSAQGPDAGRKHGCVARVPRSGAEVHRDA